MARKFEWVSVDEALPIDNQRVLGFGKRGGVNIYRYKEFESGLHYFTNSKQHIVTVTHWSPLPEPPEA